MTVYIEHRSNPNLPWRRRILAPDAEAYVIAKQWLSVTLNDRQRLDLTSRFHITFGVNFEYQCTRAEVIESNHFVIRNPFEVIALENEALTRELVSEYMRTSFEMTMLDFEITTPPRRR